MAALFGKLTVAFLIGGAAGWILCTFFNPKPKS